VHGPAPGAALAQPGAAVEVGAGFMGGTSCGAVAQREALIAACGFAGQGWAGVVLGAGEKPVAVQSQKLARIKNESACRP